MPACIILLNCNKRTELKGKILFINAYDELITTRNHAYLNDINIMNIYNSYISLKDVSNITTYIASIEEVEDNDFNLNVPVYIEKNLKI